MAANVSKPVWTLQSRSIMVPCYIPSIYNHRYCPLSLHCNNLKIHFSSSSKTHRWFPKKQVTLLSILCQSILMRHMLISGCGWLCRGFSFKSPTLTRDCTCNQLCFPPIDVTLFIEPFWFLMSGDLKEVVSTVKLWNDFVRCICSFHTSPRIPLGQFSKTCSQQYI